MSINVGDPDPLGDSDTTVSVHEDEDAVLGDTEILSEELDAVIINNSNNVAPVIDNSNSNASSSINNNVRTINSSDIVTHYWDDDAAFIRGREEQSSDWSIPFTLF